MNIEDLTHEQKEKLKACETPEELLEKSRVVFDDEERGAVHVAHALHRVVGFIDEIGRSLFARLVSEPQKTC